MNTEQARSLVRETFQQKFDKSRFRVFTINLLNHTDESNAKKWGETSIKDAFKNHVRAYECLGTYTSPEKNKLDVLVVYLTTATKLTHARTAIRNFVAEHLKTRGNQEAALVAFVSRSEQQWRFSYVTMEYTAVKTEDGKVGMKTRLTSARRSSYLVGEDESCHTAQSRFLDLLQDTESHPTLSQIENAFSIEAVTKEFFEHYKTLFLGLKDELDSLVKKDKNIGAEFAAKHISTADFAKKLMGQIIFLYFLQKKGWLGAPKDGAWGGGPHGFLRQLFDGKFRSYKNLFDDILEPLFYDTLATDRGHEAWCKTFNCRIPFLNGGLFEPLGDYDWRKTDISIPNERFSNPDRTDAGDIGTGIFDVFDRYNFTVNEAEPLEKEVAIDPEMLGQVFENLLEVKERKSKGSFYTPREIVHYMCQESLISYLDTALNNGKMTVPRDEIEIFVHSGDQAASYEAARLEGTSYQRKLPKNIETHARVLDDKLADVTVCDPAIGSGAFPVGMMQEIVRARTALTPYFNDVQERTAYQFKRHAIQHCLYGVDINPGAVEIAKLRLWLSLVVDEDNVTQIKPLPNLDYKVVTGNSLLGVKKNLLNIDLFKRLEELKPRYFDVTDRNQKETLKREIDDLIHELTSGKENFDFEIYFSEMMDAEQHGGFDVVIGNPPYVRQEVIKKLKPVFKAQGYECFSGTADLYVYFYERGITLLRSGGTLAYISSNSFLNSAFGENLRRYLSTNTRILKFIDFGEAKVFDATTEPCVISLTRDLATDHKAKFLKWDQAKPVEKIRETFETRSEAIHQSKLHPDGWQLESPAVLRLLDKLRQVGEPLGEYVDGRFYRGILTGLNKAFVVDRATRDRLIREHKSSAKLLKPFLRGRDVKRWRIDPGDSWLIFSQRGIDIRKYPAIYEHLLPFKNRLTPGKKGGRKPGSYEWYEIQDTIAYWREFERPKIVYQDIARYFGMAWDDTGAYLANTCYFIPQAEKWMLAVLLSKAMQFYVTKTIGLNKGGFIRLFSIHVEKFPIPVMPRGGEKPIERLVDRILAAKKLDTEADVSAWEREIDELVYALYGLTGTEKTIVETEAEK